MSKIESKDCGIKQLVGFDRMPPLPPGACDIGDQCPILKIVPIYDFIGGNNERASESLDERGADAGKNPREKYRP